MGHSIKMGEGSKSIHELVLIFCIFFNPVFLPFGLFYAHIYSPFASYYLLKWSKNAIFFIVSLLVAILLYSALLVATTSGPILLPDYLSTTIILFASIIFSTYIYIYVSFRMQSFDLLVDRIVKINFAVCVIAVLLFWVGVGDQFFTIQGPIEKSNRLQLFCYEPSIYALTFAPFATYALVRYISSQNNHNFFILILAAIPLILSGSAGVIGAMGMAFFLANLKSIVKFLIRKWVAFSLICVILIVAFPNMLNRYQSILEGEDYSGLVRVVFSIQAATNMLDDKDIWLLGTGPGQLKYQIEKYTSEFAAFGGSQLPNSIASTIATVGLIGLSLKLAIFFGLYFVTKSYKNNYSNTMFIFIFIYQFTGGFFNNVNEYVALAFAFGYARFCRRMAKNQFQ